MSHKKMHKTGYESSYACTFGVNSLYCANIFFRNMPDTEK